MVVQELGATEFVLRGVCNIVIVVLQEFVIMMAIVIQTKTVPAQTVKVNKMAVPLDRSVAVGAV
jgi:CTP:molybdopterin cytidylyltransferase MocA